MNLAKELASSLRVADSCWICGQGAFGKLPRSQPVVFCIFQSLIKSRKGLDNVWCRIIAWLETYIKNIRIVEGNFPSQNYSKFPMMQWGRLMVDGRITGSGSQQSSCFSLDSSGLSKQFVYYGSTRVVCNVFCVDEMLEIK